MPNYTAAKNTQFIFYMGVKSQADTKLLKVNPTIAAGDFKVSTDGGAFANLATLPVVTPAGGTAIKFTLSASEMNGDNVYVQLLDAAGAEWCDDFVNIITTPQVSNLTQIDGLATSGNNATLNLKQLNIVNNAGSAIVASSTGSNGSGIAASGNGTGHGFFGTGGTSGGNGFHGAGGATTGSGAYFTGTTSGYGLVAVGAGNTSGIAGIGNGTGNGFDMQGGSTGNGISALGGSTSGNGATFTAVGGGRGIAAVGIGANSGVYALGGTNGDGIFGQGAGTGSGIRGTGGATGIGIAAVGGSTSGEGLFATAVGGGVGLKATGVGDVAIQGTQGISGPLDASVYTSISDALLKRDMSAVTGESSRSLLNCLRFIRNKWSFSGSTLTVTKEDDTTSAWTATVTTDALALPIVSFDGN